LVKKLKVKWLKGKERSYSKVKTQWFKGKAEVAQKPNLFFWTWLGI